jgi:HD superfamily phosphohydrolase
MNESIPTAIDNMTQDEFFDFEDKFTATAGHGGLASIGTIKDSSKWPDKTGGAHPSQELSAEEWPRSHKEFSRKRFIFQDAIHGHIRLSDFEVAVLDAPHLQRLRNCLMHSTARLVYPAMTHSRFEHSIGCVALIDRVIEALSSKPESKRALQKNTDLSKAEITAFARIAALTHDIGHIPFRLVTTDSGALATIDNRTDILEAKWRLRFLQSGEFGSLINQGLSEQAGGLKAKDLCDVFARRSQRFLWLSELLEGTFDVDRCDYMLRDLQATGMSGMFDYRRIIQSLEIKSSQSISGEHYLELCAPTRAMHQLQAFTMALRLLYERLYLHRKVVAFETHWDRFCSSLKVDMNSEEDFLKLDWVTLLAKAKDRFRDNRDAHAVIKRDAFNIWATSFFLSRDVHEDLLPKIRESLNRVPGERTIDKEVFPLSHASQTQPMDSTAANMKRTINQIRVVTEADITPVVKELPLKGAA